jgi:hypothetical protein
MTTLVFILSMVALFLALGVSRQLIRTLCAWQKAMEAMRAELRGRQAPAPETSPAPESSPCPCTCHPLPTRNGGW